MSEETNSEATGCLILIGAIIALIGGAILWGPQALLIGGILIIMIAVS